MSALADPDRVLLWDLDGTIVDTSRDIATGVIEALRELRLPPLTTAQVIRNVGRGVRVLMERCLQAVGSPPQTEEEISRAVELFRRHYAVHLLDTTAPYPGMDALLRELAARGRRMAVVSNKPEDFTRDILRGLGLINCFRAVLGGDSLAERKPSPQPLLHAFQLCVGSSAIVIGDSMIDVEAARAAGFPVCGVAWGFDPDGRLRQAETDWWFERPEDLGLALLGS